MWEDKSTKLDVAKMKRTYFHEPQSVMLRLYVANFYMLAVFTCFDSNMHAVSDAYS